MSILTFTVGNNVTETVFVLPINTTLATRKIRRVSAYNQAGTGAQWRYGVTNVRTDGATSQITFTPGGVLSTNGFDHDFPEDDRLVCPANSLTTFNIVASTQLTATVALWYDETPKGSAPTGT